MTQATVRRRRRPFVALAGGVFVLVAAWSGVWIWLRGEVMTRMDAELARLQARGEIEVTCPERQVGGWPFRLVVRCVKPQLHLVASDARFDLAGLAVTGVVTQPNLIVADIAGPVHLRSSRGDVDATWSSLRFSLGFKDGAPTRFSLETSDFDGKARLPGEAEQALKLARGELHVMPAALVDKAEAAAAGTAAAASSASAAPDLRLAITAERAEATIGGAKPVPVPIDLAIDAKTSDLPSYSLAPRDLAEAGAGLDVVKARIGLGDLVLDAGGHLALSDTGTVNGVIEVQSSTATLPPGTTPAPASLKTAVTGALLMFGTTKPSQTGRTGTRLDVQVDNGVVRVGRMTLAKLRPLF